MSLLAATAIHKSFAGVRALRGVSFELLPGEVHAVVGENGAGKSTLIRIMTGAIEPDSGTLTVSQHTLARMDPTMARAMGIAVIYQQPALFPDLTVAENIALGLEIRGPFTSIDWVGRRRRAKALIEQAGGHLDPDALASTLSMPEQQIVEIARAIGADARIVIMDEPTACLSDREVDHLFGVVRRLRQSGVGLIYISHRLEEVFAIADRITVLRDGAAVGTFPTAAVSPPKLIAMMVGRELTTSAPTRRSTFGHVVLQVTNLTNQAAGLAGVSFSLREGEILGLAGLVGSGRTALAETLFGLTPADGGTVDLNGRRTVISSPAAAIRLGFAYVPEDRRRHGVIGKMTVAANTTLASLSSIARAGLVDRAAETRITRIFMRDLHVKAPSPSSLVEHLSGGNQQKVALARWLATHPTILILDEPTQGVDVSAKAEIHQVMRQLADERMAILMISSDLLEILAMSDRIAVMRRGAITAEFAGHDATQGQVLAAALGDDSGPPSGLVH